MNKNYGLVFYVKRSKMISNGTVPVYLRITVDGERVEISSKRYVNPDKWNANGQKLNGTGFLYLEGTYVHSNGIRMVCGFNELM
jgi:hypothetical protein